MTYSKIPIISHGLVQKAFWLGLFQESLLSEGFVIGRNFVFQNGSGLSIHVKTAKNTN